MRPKLQYKNTCSLLIALAYSFINVQAQTNTYAGEGTKDNGLFNVAFGQFALTNNSTGGFNVAFGKDALFSNVSNSQNTAVGKGALYTNTADKLVAVGDSALFYNTSGLYNTALGSKSLTSNSVGSLNTATGYYTLYSNKLGTCNTATGYLTLMNNTGANNTANGMMAMLNNKTGYSNTATGAYSMLTNDDGQRNTAFGYATLNYIKGSVDNTCFGTLAYGLENFDFDFGTYNGPFATGNSNTAIGSDALSTNVNGSNNTGLGPGVLNISNGNGNTAIGQRALEGYNKNKINYSTAIGEGAANTGGEYITVIGSDALLRNTSGLNNVVVGYNAMSQNTEGRSNVAIGANSGNLSVATDSSVLIGESAGSNLSGYNSLIIRGANNNLIYGDFKSGKIGIGTTNSLTSSLNITSVNNNNSKISFIDGFDVNGNPVNCGFGVLPNQFNYHTMNLNYSHVFLAGGKNGNGTESVTELMRVQGNGNVGIGTKQPSAKMTVNGNVLIGDPSISVTPATYNLSVQNGILTEKFTVELSKANGWADYVFDPKYSLKSIDEVLLNIKKDKHLYAIPSEKEIMKNGINVSDMHVKLLEKVEELYLYAIQLDEENAKLEKIVKNNK